MKLKNEGWVVVNIGHPRTGSKYIVPGTFERTRSGYIKSFVAGSGDAWKFWKKKYNFRVVKAKQCVITV